MLAMSNVRQQSNANQRLFFKELYNQRNTLSILLTSFVNRQVKFSVNTMLNFIVSVTEK